MSKGKARVVTSRRFVEGLIATVISAGVDRLVTGASERSVAGRPMLPIGQDVSDGREMAITQKSVTPALVFDFLTRARFLGYDAWPSIYAV